MAVNIARIITDNIEKAAKQSIEAGKEKYIEYFIKSGDFYKPYQEEVNSMLSLDGYEDVIPVLNS